MPILPENEQDSANLCCLKGKITYFNFYINILFYLHSFSCKQSKPGEPSYAYTCPSIIVQFFKYCMLLFKRTGVKKASRKKAFISTLKKLERAILKCKEKNEDDNAGKKRIVI